MFIGTTKIHKIFFVIFASFVVSLLAYVVYRGVVKRGFFPTSALTITSLSNPLSVVVNGVAVGSTPYQVEDLRGDSVDVVLSTNNFSYSTTVRVLSMTRSIINWGLGPSTAFSFGEHVWLEESKSGSALVVISSPGAARVKIDGVLAGVTPFSTSDISLGEHTVAVSKDGYQERKIRVNLQESYKLNLKVQLLLEPFTLENTSLLEFPSSPTASIYDLSTKEAVLYSDPSGWAHGLGYWVTNKGGSDQGTLQCDYYVDFNGAVYGSDGQKLDDSESSDEKLETLKIGYLGKRSNDETSVSEEATASINSLTNTVLVEVLKVKILPTGLGWLRARSGPGIGNEEVAKLDEGNEYVAINTESGWYEILLENGDKAWVIGQYVSEIK